MLSNIINKSKQEDFILFMVNRYVSDENPEYREMIEGWDYYSKNNKLIEEKKRLVIGIDSENRPFDQESKVLSCTKLSHNYYRKLVNQKVSYVLGRPFTIKQTTGSDETNVNNMIVDTSKYLTDSLYDKIQKAGRDGIIGKLGWIYTYYENNSLHFDRIDPKQVIPVWKNDTNKELDAVIHKYSRYEFVKNQITEIKCVDFYTIDGRTKYEYENTGRLNKVSELEPYISINGKSMKWDRIPWTWFKYDDDSNSLLSKVKSLIDEYDYLTSAVSDMIKDNPNSYMVIKGYSAASVEEFQKNSTQYRKLFVQADGGVDTLEQPLQIDQIMLHIEQIRKDIYEFGQGVDAVNKEVKNTSYVALRHLYSDLDMDCSYWMTQLKQSIHNIFYFILVDIMLREGKDYIDTNFDILFNISVITNKTEDVQNLVALKGIQPTKTLLEFSPYTINGEEEYSKYMQEVEDQFQRDLKLKKNSSSQSQTNNSD